jgi:RNA polymerase sigma-70 factor (ECF subfamily)
VERYVAVTDLDRQDIGACLQGDEAAYGRLIRRYEPWVATLMWRLCHDRDACEELTQDVFVEAYLNLASYRGEASFGSWLRRIASRIGFRYCQKTAGKPVHLPIEAWDESKVEARKLEPVEAEATLHALLARLKPEERMILTMIYFEDCSTREIAERTGWKSSMIKMRASRARDKLRELIERTRQQEGRA